MDNTVQHGSPTRLRKKVFDTISLSGNYYTDIEMNVRVNVNERVDSWIPFTGSRTETFHDINEQAHATFPKDFNDKQNTILANIILRLDSD